MLKQKVRRSRAEQIYLLTNKHPTRSQKNQVSLDNAEEEARTKPEQQKDQKRSNKSEIKAKFIT